MCTAPVVRAVVICVITLSAIRVTAQRTHDTKIKSLWRQNDVATSCWRHNDVIIASCAGWEILLMVHIWSSLFLQVIPGFRHSGPKPPAGIMLTTKLRYVKKMQVTEISQDIAAAQRIKYAATHTWIRHLNPKSWQLVCVIYLYTARAISHWGVSCPTYSKTDIVEHICLLRRATIHLLRYTHPGTHHGHSKVQFLYGLDLGCRVVTSGKKTIWLEQFKLSRM